MIDPKGFKEARLSPSTIERDEPLNFGNKTINLPTFVELSLRDIDNLPTEHITSIVEILMESSKKRLPAREAAKRYQEFHAVDRQTALNIVSLQLGRISTILARERAIEAGLTHFKWRWSGALDEDPSHKARDGIVLAWSDPVINGVPLGIFELPNMSASCKCRAQSV